MERTFLYAVGDAWIVGMYGVRAKYTIKKAEFRVRDHKEIYTVDIDGQTHTFTKNRLHYLLHLGAFKQIEHGKRGKYRIPEPPCNIVVTYFAGIRYAEEKRIERITERLEHSEQYRTAQREISNLSMQLAKAEYNRANVIEIRRLKKQLSEAQAARIDVLTKLGYTEEDLKKRVQCSICGDYGYLQNGEACKCIERHQTKIYDLWEKENGGKVTKR